MNINTMDYWNKRFTSHDWNKKGGNVQSKSHANYYVEHLGIPREFTGTICDFGCAEGDAFPVYKSNWPDAKLVGVDFSVRAIEHAQENYGSIGNFICSDFQEIPQSEIMISSHTFEHIENELDVLDQLLSKCAKLFVIVPYKESPLGSEHLRRYDYDSFRDYTDLKWYVCGTGWPFEGLSLFMQIYVKNLIRPIIGRPVVRMPQQIIFQFQGKMK